MKCNIPRIIIAAPQSGSGKSTIATGLMALLCQDFKVQGFKVGPDYIDPGYHTLATGRVSRNLDTWMMASEDVKTIFGQASEKADIAIIEGVMGLYDGFNAISEAGSTAQVAKLLKAPVILVIDVGKMARSAGAIALGYREFDPEINLAGVICNRVGSERHAQWVTEAIGNLGIPVLGCIPKSTELKIPERHLGLHMAHENNNEVQTLLNTCVDLFEKNINIDDIWQIARKNEAVEFKLPLLENPNQDNVTIAVARDEAFCFYYEDNLDALRHAGARIIYFSPLHDTTLPENIHGIYLGGGYPELFAEDLARNDSMHRSIRDAWQNQIPIYAECGGLMVLTHFITDLENEKHMMYALIPGHAEMVNKLTMGYRQIVAEEDTLILKKGQTARGHEFHYSRWLSDKKGDQPAYQIKPRTGTVPTSEGFSRGNLLASYVHIHFGSNPETAVRFVNTCHDWRKGRLNNS